MSHTSLATPNIFRRVGVLANICAFSAVAPRVPNALLVHILGYFCVG